MEKAILNRAAIVGVGLFIFNTVSVWLSLYTIFWYFDMPAHFFGGLFIGLLSIHLFLRFKIGVNMSTSTMAILVITTVLLIAVAWEVYEFGIGHLAGQKYIMLDTISDICFGVAGAIEALFIYMRQKRILGQ